MVSSNEVTPQHTPLLRDRSTTLESERGALIVILAAMLFCLLAFVGLAIDGGSIYLRSVELQKAVDAAVLVGAKRAALWNRGSPVETDAFTRAAIEEAAVAAMHANLRLGNGMNDLEFFTPNGSPAGNDLDISLDTERVSAKARVRVPIYLLRAIPGFASSMEISARATAEVQRSIINLLIDTSASMACPETGTSCACQPFCSNPRIFGLRQAVMDFLPQFNALRDIYYVNFFSVASAPLSNQLLPSPGDTNGGFPGETAGLATYIDPTNGPIANLPVQGSTNPCDALRFAMLVPENVATAFAQGRRQWGRDNVAYIIFTDGPPTALFYYYDPSAVSGLTPSDPSAPLPYYQYGYYYFDTTAGMSPLIPPGPDMDAFWTDGFAPPAPLIPPCTDNTGPPSLALGNCLSSRTFRTPYGRLWPQDANWGNYKQDYYHCAIATADAIRDMGGVVYVVGLGESAGFPPGDPYQDINEYELRKDIYLTRLANAVPADPNWPAFPAPIGGTYIPAPVAGYGDPVPSHLAQGAYFPTPDARTLPDLFDQLRRRLVRRIKTVQLRE